MARLSGRRAVITGGASGIGLATARVFLREGAAVAVVDRDPAALERGAVALDGRASTIAGDASDEADVARGFRHAGEALGGPPDVLVAAAGFSTGRGVADETLADWRAVVDASLTGSFLWSRAVLPDMIAARRGAIALVGSQLALAGGRSNAAYLAAKGAVMALGRTMAVDHAADGVRVNVVVPGAIDTPLLTRAFARAPDPDAARARSVARHPMGRLGEADEVARAILFLCSDESSFTTGSCLMVDGGWLAG
jgi:NAD(P)-dependent dehydrogenase (short-subunit alcohol dehydrogenase family)